MRFKILITTIFAAAPSGCGGSPFLELPGYTSADDVGQADSGSTESDSAERDDASGDASVALIGELAVADTSPDASPDASADTSTDAFPDAPPDASPTSPDALPDALPSALPDAPLGVSDAPAIPIDACGQVHRDLGSGTSWEGCYPASTYDALSASDACSAFAQVCGTLDVCGSATVCYNRCWKNGSSPRPSCISNGCAADGSRSVCTTVGGPTGQPTLACWVFTGPRAGTSCVGGPCASDCVATGTWQ